MALPLGDQHMGKRMKMNAEGEQAPDATSLQMPTKVEETKGNGDDIDLESVIEPLEDELVVDPSVLF